MKRLNNPLIASLSVSILGAMSPVLVRAQPATGSFMNDPLAHPLFPFYALMAFIFLVVILVLLVAVYMLRVLNIFTRQAAQEKAKRLGIRYVPEPSMWEKLNSRLTRAVPVEKEETVMLDHNYDGIRELDNHLPPWWKWLFYATIAWSAVYLFVYHVSGSLPLMEEEYEIELAKAESNKPVTPKVDETSVTMTSEPAVLQRGKDLYVSNCASCHKADGGGDIGPNLTDDYWIHGGDIKDVFRTVSEGVAGTNMIPWKGIMSPEKISEVSNFVMSLKGTAPQGGKAPQGELWTPDGGTETKDTTADSLANRAAL